jgi:UDP-N-acetylglucosamine kinase
MDDESLHNKIILFAKANKKRIAKEIVLDQKYPVDQYPVSIFMAGSPGAGKTESAKRLIEDTSINGYGATIHIDTDELRSRFIEYNGSNSYLFQGATSIIASSIQDLAREQKKSFIFDGTLSDYDRARKNIEDSLKRKRKIDIYFVYQNPLQAWRFVQEREKYEGRHIPKEDFIEKYFASREVVNRLKKEFRNKIQVSLLVKNIDGSDSELYLNIERIDDYIQEMYNRDMLRNAII